MQEPDDPNAPAALPASGQVAGWKKLGPIRVAAPEQMDRLALPAIDAKAAAEFRVERIARCKYRWIGTGAVIGLEVDVEFVEASSPGDALGLFSILSPPATRMRHRDGSIRAQMTWPAEREASLLAWQGSAFVRLRAHTTTGEAAGENALAAWQALLDHITAGTPKTALPEPLRLFPDENQLEGQTWLVRRAVTLSLGPGAKDLPIAEPSALDALLGLQGNAWLAVRAYRADPEELPDFVWLARYDRPIEAQDAYERYDAARRASDAPGETSVLLYLPKGRYLAGTWTPEQESILYVLPQLLRAIPE